MAETPKSIKVELDWSRPELKEALEKAEQVGFEEGLDQGRKEFIDWLEYAYIEDPGRPDRGTPKAEAMLELATSGVDHLVKLRKGKK